jgi:hypothetical protein
VSKKYAIARLLGDGTRDCTTETEPVAERALAPETAALTAAARGEAAGAAEDASVAPPDDADWHATVSRRIAAVAGTRGAVILGTDTTTGAPGRVRGTLGGF